MFAKQNYTMLDNLKLGYGGTKAEMERLLEDAEKLSGRDFDISSYSDIIEAIHIIQEDIGIAGTTVEEQMTTIEGSLGRLSATWSNWLTALATSDMDLTEKSDELVEAFVGAMELIIPRVGYILQSLGTAIASEMPRIASDIGNGLKNALSLAFESLGGDSSTIASFFGALRDIFDTVGKAINEMLVPAFAVLKDAIVYMMQAAEPLMPVFTTVGQILGSFLVGAFMAVVLAISGVIAIIGAIMNAISAFIGACQNAAQSVVGAFTSIKDGASNAMNSLIDFVAGIPGRIVGFFSGLGQRITAAIGSIHFPTPQISWESVSVGPASFSIPNITWAAQGGIFAPNAPRILGLGDNTRYDEAALPLSPSVLAGIGRGVAQYGGVGGGGNINVYINNAQVNSDEAINASVYNVLTTLQRRGRM